MRLTTPSTGPLQATIARRVRLVSSRRSRSQLDARYSGGNVGIGSSQGAPAPARQPQQAGYKPPRQPATYPPPQQQQQQPQQYQQAGQQAWASAPGGQAYQQQWQEPQRMQQPPMPVRKPVPPESACLARSQLVDKAVITRTSGKQLGYVSQLYVDPASLEVFSLYLRDSLLPGASLVGSSSLPKHVLLSSLRQIGDVILVHNEDALAAPQADEGNGYARLIGYEVWTQGGAKLGRVRDFKFSPDTGALGSIKYDFLGLPSIPELLLSCYSIGAEHIQSVGINRVILYSNAEQYARKETDGLVDEGMKALADLVTATDKQAASGSGGGGGGVDRDAQVRSDAAYEEWYFKYAQQYEEYSGSKVPLPKSLQLQQQQQRQRQQQQPQQQQARPRARPAALPPPRSTPYAAAVQPQQPQQQRQAVPVGGGAAPQPRAMPRQQPIGSMPGRGSGSGMLLDVQRRPLPPRQPQGVPPQQAGAPAPRSAPMQQQAPPMQQPPVQQQQQQPAPAGRNFTEVVQPDAIVQPDMMSG